jgi:hypothetical protein
MELLRYFGFSTNKEKSFVVGPFRESCGTDWYAGADVRPCVVDKKIDSLSALYALHNGTLRNESTTNMLDALRGQLVSFLPPGLRLYGLKGDWIFKTDPVTGKLDVADSYLGGDLDVCMSSPYFNWDRDVQAWT